jgi:hypothetical protein
MLDVLLCRLGSVVRGMVKVALSGMSVMGRHFVIACFVMLCGFAMMASCMFVVFGRLVMMFCRLLGHVSSVEIGLDWQRVDCARID